MSWTQWTNAAPPAVVPGLGINPVVNPAPTVIPPATQYTPEQWAQMQQQNWQQWAQWQQQYQQWHQQYGAEYQKSVNALSQAALSTPVTNTSVPPPLPTEAKPPLPPEEPPQTPIKGYSTGISAPPHNYKTLPSNQTFKPAVQGQQISYKSGPSNQQSGYQTGSLNNQQVSYNTAPPNQQQPSYNASPQNKPQPYNAGSANQYSSEPQNQPYNAGPSNKPYRNTSANQSSGFRGSGTNQQRNFNYNAQNRNQNWQTSNQGNFNNSKPPPNLMSLTIQKPGINPAPAEKRPFSQPDIPDPNKKNKFADDSKSNQPQSNPLAENNSALQITEDLSETEKKFIKQFTEWEAQFNKWKDQNMNHPDKDQYREYEKKWEAWRTQLLERREQMRRKRLGLTGDSPCPEGKSPTDVTKQINAANVIQSQDELLIPNLTKPPPNMNNEPLEFKKSGPDAEVTNEQKENVAETSIKNALDNAMDEIQNEEVNDGTGFLKMISSDGIPGLDLVKDTKDENKSEDDNKDFEVNKGADLEALSKGINNILGDQKLLSMLSMVTQNQNFQTPSVIDTTSKIQSDNLIGQHDFASKDDPNPKIFSDQTQNAFRDDSFSGDRQTFSRNENQFEPLDRFKEPHNRFGGPNVNNEDSNFKQQNNFRGADPLRGEGIRGPAGFRESDFTGPNVFRETDSFNKGPDNFKGADMNKDTYTDDFRAPDNFRGPDKFRGSDNFRDTNQFRGHDTFRGPDNIRGNDNFRGSDKFRGPDNFRESDNFRGIGTFRGRGNFRRPEQFSGPDNYKGPNNFREDDDFRGPNSSRGNSKFRGTGNSRGFNSSRQHDDYGGPDNFRGGPDGEFEDCEPIEDPEAFADPDNFYDEDDFEQPERFREPEDEEASENFEEQESFGGPDDFSDSSGYRGQNEFRGSNHFRDPNTFRGADTFGGNNFRMPNANRNSDTFRDGNYRRPGNFRGQGNMGRPNAYHETDNLNRTPKDFNLRESQESNNFGRWKGGPDTGHVNLQDNFNKRNSEIPMSESGDMYGTDDHNNFAANVQDESENLINEPGVLNSGTSNIPDAQNSTLLPAEAKEDDNMWKPHTMVDYDHKSIKPAEPEITLEPVHTFDYRHKPVNRIPFPQRPVWLKNTLKNCREFDFMIRPPLEPTYSRYPPVERFSEKRFFENRHDNRYSDSRYPDSRFADEKETRRTYRDSYKREDSAEPMRRYDDYGSSYNRRSRDTFDSKKDYDKFEGDDDWESREDEPAVKKQCDIELSGDSKSKDKPFIENRNKTPSVILIEDILNSPGRFNRPARIVIILRGPPGSGKTFLAKLIKDKEVENGGSAPRILSLDDYFMVEQEKEVEEDGKKIKVKEMVYEYEECMEATYRASILKAFKKTITDGYFSFIIVDNVNDKVKYFGEMWSFAKQNGFQVYVTQLELDVQTCTKRNVHGRSEIEIQRLVAGWESTPSHHSILDSTGLVQSASIPDVEMEEINSPPSEDIEEDSMEEQACRSKWDNFDCSNDNLAKLDGISKPLRASKTMEDYLQLEDEWISRPSVKPGQKQVRWADLEERKQQEKMRAIGFVVGQTNWDRMMDPTMGGSALTQTKYFERTPRYYRD